MKVYIVDDDADMIEVMTLMLDAAGHRVASSVAGATAIPQIVEFKPDILLTDLVMAELDGLELCHELRENKGLRAMSIAFVSAKTDEFWRERASNAGAVGYISKPLDTNTFVETVEAFAAQ
ncbi:MAG: response regulator [Alphaproteobacteria bacterium]|jgi:DNA-binding response OmpR family regulator|nr:response regulator [Alphaproteobacteria bacterium]